MSVFFIFVACSARPFSSDPFSKEPTNIIDEEEVIASSESAIEAEDDESKIVEEEDTSSVPAPTEEETNTQSEDSDVYLIADATCVSPCSFSIDSHATIVRVVYKADSWDIGESDNSQNNFAITYDFHQAGERNIQAFAYDLTGNLVDSDKKIVDVEIEYESQLPDVPYYYQYNNTQSPNSTCANTSVAMVLSYYGWSDTPDVITNYYGVSTAQTPSGLASVFNSEAAYFNMSQRLLPITDGSISELHAELDSGNPVIVHGYFTNAGHVLVVLGYDQHGYWVNDPAGTWDQQFKGGYPYGWEPTSGDAIYYSKFNFELAITSLNGTDYAPIWMHFVR